MRRITWERNGEMLDIELGKALDNRLTDPISGRANVSAVTELCRARDTREISALDDETWTVIIRLRTDLQMSCL